MRHLKAGRRLGRNSAHRKAMYRNMVTSLMIHGRIRTTEAKAKELRKVAERMITLGKRVPPSALEGLEGDELNAAKAERVHYIRRVRRTITDRDALGLVFNDYAERFKDRPGGYTRIMKAGFRKGDQAPMAIIELVESMADAAAAKASEGAAADAAQDAGEE